MIEKTSTYELASKMVASHVQPLWSGDLAAPFETRDEDGRWLNLADDHLFGPQLIKTDNWIC